MFLKICYFLTRTLFTFDFFLFCFFFFGPLRAACFAKALVCFWVLLCWLLFVALTIALQSGHSQRFSASICDFVLSCEVRWFLRNNVYKNSDYFCIAVFRDISSFHNSTSALLLLLQQFLEQDVNNLKYFSWHKFLQ